jgi:hypothetical protein
MFQVEADEAHHAFFVIHSQDTAALKVVHILFPHKADDVFFFFAWHDFDKVDAGHGPHGLDNVALQVVNVFTIPAARVVKDEQRVAGLGQFIYFANDWIFTSYMEYE